MKSNLSSRSNVRLTITAFLLGLVCLLFLGWTAFPELLYERIPQPLDFNHRLHTKLADDGCNSCHFFRPDESFSGIPGIRICMTCHTEIEGESRAEAKLIDEYIDKQQEIPWLVHARQPNNVYFSHAAHVRIAGLPCGTCHGEIGEAVHAGDLQRNVLTGYSREVWKHMKMDDCATCHAEAKHDAASVQTDRDGCFVCHK